MSGQSNGALRVLAPIALLIFGIVFLIVVFSSLSGPPRTPVRTVGDDGQSKVKTTKTEEDPATSETTTDELGTDPSTTLVTTKSTYTVKTGDTLEGISSKTGIDVDELLALNPDLDPQALTPGSKLTLTE
jgi:LysM repeat protein